MAALHGTVGDVPPWVLLALIFLLFDSGSAGQWRGTDLIHYLAMRSDSRAENKLLHQS